MFLPFSNYSLKRAFKTPLLCDITKIRTGFGIMPKVTHLTDDDRWSKPGTSKKVHVAKSFSQKGSFASLDHILERKENHFWIIQVDNFQSWMLVFYKFVGEWKTTPINIEEIKIDYSYRLHIKGLVFTRFAGYLRKHFGVLI